MTIKKISAKDVKIIMGYKKLYLKDYFIKWHLREAGNTIVLSGNYRNILKILLTPIFVAAIILYSLWDGGIKSAIEELKIPMWYISPIVEYENYYADSRYNRMKKVLENKEKSLTVNKLPLIIDYRKRH